MPGVPITIFTDSSLPNHGLFDQKYVLPRPVKQPYRTKLSCWLDSPYERTLFLDTDTFLCHSVAELFDLLEHFDMAMTHDRSYKDEFPENVGVPPVFREFNSGVAAFRSSDAVHEVLRNPLDWYDHLVARGNPAYDRPPLRIALYQSPVRIAPLSLKYNCRFVTFGYVNSRVKVLHGRPRALLTAPPP